LSEAAALLALDYQLPTKVRDMAIPRGQPAPVVADAVDTDLADRQVVVATALRQVRFL
jgi:hypothetical protein